MKGVVYMPLLSNEKNELMAQIMKFVVTINNAMLKCVQYDLNYWLDVYCVINSARIEQL